MHIAIKQARVQSHKQSRNWPPLPGCSQAVFKILFQLTELRQEEHFACFLNQTFSLLDIHMYFDTVPCCAIIEAITVFLSRRRRETVCYYREAVTHDTCKRLHTVTSLKHKKNKTFSPLWSVMRKKNTFYHLSLMRLISEDKRVK